MLTCLCRNVKDKEIVLGVMSEILKRSTRTPAEQEYIDTMKANLIDPEIAEEIDWGRRGDDEILRTRKNVERNVPFPHPLGLYFR